jgi:hypothetical protein
MSAESAKFEAGLVYFPERAPWLPELEAELFAFPGSRHDESGRFHFAGARARECRLLGELYVTQASKCALGRGCRRSPSAARGVGARLWRAHPGGATIGGARHRGARRVASSTAVAKRETTASAPPRAQHALGIGFEPVDTNDHGLARRSHSGRADRGPLCARQVCHAGRFSPLEEQMLNMSSAGYVGAISPTGSTHSCGRSRS